MHESIFKKFHNLNDSEWTELLFKSVDSQIIDGVRFPGFPDENIQVGTIGSSGKDSLLEPKVMYNEIRRIVAQQNRPFDEKTTLLDFACGYGRNVRFFMKDIYPGNLYASDVRADSIDLCRSTFSDVEEQKKRVKFDINKPFPPFKYKAKTFDIIMAYSLFSHLSEDAHLAWLKEFLRVLKNDGLLFLTIRQQSFLTLLNSISGDKNISEYNKMLVKNFCSSFVQERFDNGEYIFNPSVSGSGLTNDFYGDAMIPDKYIHRRWVKWFDVVEYYDDLSKLPQAFICLRKKRGPLMPKFAKVISRLKTIKKRLNTGRS
jgi:SAM-dependent methyltransferase